jgi:lipid A 4'-phosphatase
MTRWAVIGLVLASALFWAVPGLDLAVSGFFYDGAGFPVRSTKWFETIRLTLYAAEDAAAVVTLALGIVTAWRGVAVLKLAARDWFYAFGVFALGPGLVVNGILKRFWGRARPSAVVEFGGTAQFTPPWQIADQCPKNCSFVSGEMAGAVALGDDLIGSFAGGGVLSKLSRRFGEGVVNGALTARVGLAAMDLCRPLPWVAQKRPGVSVTVSRALAGLCGRD